MTGHVTVMHRVQLFCDWEYRCDVESGCSVIGHVPEMDREWLFHEMACPCDVYKAAVL